MPKPGPVVCAEAWSRSGARPPVACPSPARSCAPKPCRRSRSKARPGAGNCPARPGPALPGPGWRRGRETGKTDSTTVEITCACRRMTDRARRFANFWKQIRLQRKTTLSVGTGDRAVLSNPVMRKTTKFDRLRRVSV